MASQLGKWEADAAATRSDVAGAIGAKGDALKGSIQEAARAFAEKQIYKRKFIEQVDDAYKAKALTAKVDLEDKLFQEVVKGIWASFTEEAAGVEAMGLHESNLQYHQLGSPSQMCRMQGN